MALLHLGSDDALLYTHTPPSRDDGLTYVFFNALTGDFNAWEAVIAPALRAQGHGSLVWNYRGQAHSLFSPGLELGSRRLIDDGKRLLDEVNPVRPVLVGLSIGGLFAARAILEGSPAQGLVLINTLRRPGPRLSWVNDALLRAAQVGGLELLRDLYTPLLFNEDWQAAHRDQFLQDQNYVPLESDHGHYRLLADCRDSDWDLPYEQLTLPVLVVTGLQDKLFLDRDDVAALYARLPQARRVDLPEAAHMIPAERPEVLTRVLADFGAGL